MASVKAVESSKSPQELASTKMANYLQQVKAYFSTEVQCIEELKSRRASNTSQVSSLKLEHEQVSGLGMTATTSQIEGAIASKEKAIMEDSKVIASFTSDTTSMLDDLVARLTAYTKSATEESIGLQSDHISLLIDIRGDLKRLVSEERLAVLETYMPESADNKPTVANSSTDTTASSVATPPSIVPTPVLAGKSVPPLVGNGPSALPKLTWATTAKPTTSGSKSSLLDIQKEELESKK
jgi:hypothetical protein